MKDVFNKETSQQKGRELLRECAKRRPDMKKILELIGSGADINVKNEHRHTALISSAWRGHTEIARLLVDKGAALHEKDYDGNTALSRAVKGGHWEIVRLIEDAPEKRRAALIRKNIFLQKDIIIAPLRLKKTENTL